MTALPIAAPLIPGPLLEIPGHGTAELTRTAATEMVQRGISPDELAGVLASAWGMVRAIDRSGARKGMPVYHKGLTVVLAPGRVIVSTWRGRPANYLAM